MKKLMTIAGAVLALALLAGCGSTKEVVFAATDVPEWYVIEPVSKDGIYGTGQAKMADFDTSLKMAEANAYTSLSRKLETVVKAVSQTMILASKEDTMKGFEENALQTSKATIAGAQRTNFYQGKDGTVYIQLFLPYETGVKNLNSVAADYKISAENLATQIKMQEAYEKYFSNKEN